MPIQIIKDPVTGKQYSRDTSVQGSTYEPYTTPAAPTNTKSETPASALPPLPSAGGTGDLGNLRTALRSAFSEAAQGTAANRISQLSGLVGGGANPSVINAAIGLAQSGLKTSQETALSDVMSAYKDATDAKKSELDKINVLRSQYGSLVPSNVADLKTALDLIAPSVDKKNKLEFDKMAKDLQDSQAADNDIETWAEGLADGTYKPGNVPAAIRTKAVVRADTIRKKLEVEAKEEYKSRIAFRLEKKTSDFETERSLVMQDSNLNVAEQRDMIDYVDQLEQAQKAASKSSGKGFFSFLNFGGGGSPSNPAPTQTPTPTPAPKFEYTPPSWMPNIFE